jgi:hypothetical protein
MVIGERRQERVRLKIANSAAGKGKVIPKAGATLVEPF